MNHLLSTEANAAVERIRKNNPTNTAVDRVYFANPDVLMLLSILDSVKEKYAALVKELESANKVCAEYSARLEEENLI